MSPPRQLSVVLGSVVLAIALVSLVVAPSWAGPPTDQLKVSVDKVVKILQDPTLKSEARTKERRAAIREAVNDIFDFQETAQRALGRHWQSLSDKERAEFVALFTEFLERAYIFRVEQYSGEKISYLGESVDPGGDLATVKTAFIGRNDTEVPIDYRVLRRDNRWMVYDVSIEGSSLVANYRAQFDRVIRTASYDELVRRLKARQTEFTAPGASPPKEKARRS